MGHDEGFLQWRRESSARRAPEARLGDWKEVYLEREPEQSRQQGGRCMDCGVPFCMQGCPLGNRIPDWNNLIYRDRWRAAHEALHSTNNFPEFTGRLCPAPCESACVLAINDDPVTIEHIEKEIIERAFAEGWVRALPAAAPTGHKVAIVGSGPAGLAAAEQLASVGHEVVVYEQDAAPGGLLRYGIPDFKMEKWVIDRRLELLDAAGVQFRTGVTVGLEPTWNALRARHDAILVAIGAGVPNELAVPGRDLEGVHIAMDYLTQQNRVVSGEAWQGDRIDALGRHVIVLGGGDTGSDCLGTALRQGASSVTQIELLPRPPDARAEQNPWPQWPLVMRTSSSQEEGGARDFAVRTTHLSGENGVLGALHAVRVEAESGADGLHFRDISNSELTLPVDLLILALGFSGPAADPLEQELEVARDERGNIAVDSHFRTSLPGVYAAGDASRGASLIVWAISDGREAARTIDADLMAREPRLPTRGKDRHFGGR